MFGNILHMTEKEGLDIIQHFFVIGQIALVPLVVLSIIKLPKVERKSVFLLLAIIASETSILIGKYTSAFEIMWYNVIGLALIKYTFLFIQLFLWGAYSKMKWLYIGLGIFILAWLVAVYPYKEFTGKPIAMFCMGYALLHVLLGIDVVNRLMKYPTPLKKDYKFIGSICIIALASFSILFDASGVFYETVGVQLFIYVTIFCKVMSTLINVVFLYAILWIPKEPKYSRW